MHIEILGTFSAPQSPVLNKNKRSSDKLLRISGKRKLILSPFKDMMIFFGNQAFNKLNPVRIDQKQKNSLKLVLDKRQATNVQTSPQKKNTPPVKRQNKAISITNSTRSNQSKNKQANESQQKLQKLKKQVDQIRRKYSYNKIAQRTFVKSVDNSQSLRLSTQNSSRITDQSMRNSKEKRYLMTPKNDRYLGKRILTKNVFAEQKTSKLRLENTKLTKTLEVNKKHSQEMRRQGSCQLKDLTSSMNLSQEMTQINQKQLLQFTFGSMAMMDFQSKQNRKGNTLKI